MKKENAYKSDYRRADQVGVYIMMRNKLKTIRTYNNRKAFKRLNTPGDFLNAVRKFESESERKKSAAEKAASLWFLERLIREARIFDNGSFLLTEPAIERFKPILHVGWGMDVLSETGFDFPRYTTVIKCSADPKYKLFLTADRLASSDLGSEETCFFHDGITSALSFLEWSLPGLLESLEKNRYTEKAREMVNSYRTSGGVNRF
jgi:hypothetical protein